MKGAPGPVAVSWLLLLAACTGAPQESAPSSLVPDELPALVAAQGQSRTLQDYLRPGLDDGHPAILWITIQGSGEVGTWVGLDAPWRGEGCADGCYEVEAPAGALVSLQADGPPALVAIDPEAPMGDVVGVLRSLEAVGIDAHLLVAPDGKPPTGTGTAIEVLPGRVGKAESCGGHFRRQAPFSEAVTAGCDAVVVDVFAATAAPARSTFGGVWGGMGGLGNRRFRCSVELVDFAIEGIVEEAIRPELEPRLNEPEEARALARCGMARGGGGPFRFELAIEQGVPVRVATLEGQAGAFADCASAVLGEWRFTTDATGSLAIGMEVACTPR